ncbi:Haloacid dehalogenase, type II [hydrothermal vent metagenome]|uniref:Haloacid dehalogenase, type II n=1 Tax=hydrothermal vent metagenome TaxID=652676 RepID=A0A3B1E962_9ZZZZ
MYTMKTKLLLAVFLSLVFVSSVQSQELKKTKIKAIAFDAFPIFDPRPIAKSAEEAFPGKGKRLMEVWRTRIFEYQWLRALGGKYENFMQAAESGLVFAAAKLELELTPKKKAKLLSEFMSLNVWPDAAASIKKLKKMGFKLVFLSNMTEKMLNNGLKKANLDKDFTLVISTDLIRSYKPDPKAYHLAVEKLSLKKEEILFVAFAGWDVAGAKWYGYPTYWVNRLDAPKEQLGVTPDGSGKNLSGLIEFVSKINQNK